MYASFIKFKYEKQTKEIEVYEKKYKKLARDYNALAKEYNRAVVVVKALQAKCKALPPTLSPEDIKRLKYYIHPDKHQGKTNDLFVKIGKL